MTKSVRTVGSDSSQVLRGLRRTLSAPLGAWGDPAFRYIRSANLILKAVIVLHKLHLLPRAILPPILTLTGALTDKGKAHRRSNGEGGPWS